jgi:hypothetical protein
MNPRTLYTSAAIGRSAILIVAGVDLLLTSDIAVALIVAPDDRHSVMLFGLQLVHIFTLLVGATVIVCNQRAHAMLNVLYVIYLVAFVLDVIGAVGHGILVFSAETTHERRNEIVYVFLTGGLILVDAVGVYFIDRLRDAYGLEQRYLEQLAARPIDNR